MCQQDWPHMVKASDSSTELGLLRDASVWTWGFFCDAPKFARAELIPKSIKITEIGY